MRGTEQYLLTAEGHYPGPEVKGESHSRHWKCLQVKGTNPLMCGHLYTEGKTPCVLNTADGDLWKLTDFPSVRLEKEWAQIIHISNLE